MNDLTLTKFNRPKFCWKFFIHVIAVEQFLRSSSRSWSVAEPKFRNWCGDIRHFIFGWKSLDEQKSCVKHFGLSHILFDHATPTFCQRFCANRGDRTPWLPRGYAVNDIYIYIHTYNIHCNIFIYIHNIVKLDRFEPTCTLISTDITSLGGLLPVYRQIRVKNRNEFLVKSSDFSRCVVV